ncbi:MAG: radical SAM/Cys-rich protein [Oleiphilaceae bacterium]|jgi:radical SAM/Cys-rich protein
MYATLPLLEVSDFPSIKRSRAETLQVNLGYLCNQRCLHCHVNAGPHRTEMMDEQNLSRIVPVMLARNIQTLDLTGGAPEMHQGFRKLVQEARAAGINVIDRCNLTILFEPGYEGLAEFLAENEVEVVASLPCYSLENVDKQRGEGVFDKSIAALQKLNALGYAQEGSSLKLNLVFNPQGASLPPNQETLQIDYKRELKSHFDIKFNELYVVTNMPIKRFGSTLISKGEFVPYMKLLKDNFSSANLKGVMCRSLISVDWLGNLYDCDFNQQLELPLKASSVNTLEDLFNKEIDGHDIAIADHCFGCTAGQGSSCGGAL